MKLAISHRDMIAEGRRLERDGKWPDAAAAYQQVVDKDGLDQEAVGRLLVIYRKLKEYDKELSVIKTALAAFELRDKERQAAWLRAHPKAAGAGKAIFRQLGGAGAAAFDADPVMSGLLKRKAVVEKRLDGGKTKTEGAVKRLATKSSRSPGKGETKKGMELIRKETKPLTVVRGGKAPQRKAGELTQNRQRDALNEKAAARKRAEEDRRKERQKQAAKAKERPSLFVVSLRYLAELEKIDSVMPRHLAFLDKHYKSGDFLVSGRQVPRTGGIIIARGKDRAAVERMMLQDPFVKNKLASVDIVEFSASQMAKGLEKWVKR